MTKNKLFTTFVIIGLCVLAVMLARQPGGLAVFFGGGADARSKGPANAPLQIVEYFDYQCGACQKAAGVLNDYFSKYPFKIRVQAISHPLKAHRYGLRSAVYAECAAKQGKFWPFHEALLSKQGEWSPLPSFPDDKFLEYAKVGGLDAEKLSVCVNDPATERAVLERQQSNTKNGIRSTPTFYLNGKMVVGAQAVAEELAIFFKEKKDKDRMVPALSSGIYGSQNSSGGNNEEPPAHS